MLSVMLSRFLLCSRSPPFILFARQFIIIHKCSAKQCYRLNRIRSHRRVSSVNVKSNSHTSNCIIITIQYIIRGVHCFFSSPFHEQLWQRCERCIYCQCLLSFIETAYCELWRWKHEKNIITFLNGFISFRFAPAPVYQMGHCTEAPQ